MHFGFLHFVSFLLINVYKSSSIRTDYTTCGEWMKYSSFGTLTDGVYQIHNNETQSSIKVYCTFDYIRNYSFTLIESASLVNMQSTTVLANAAFTSNITYNIHNVNHYRHFAYRLSREWMLHLETKSTFLFATCNFNTNFTRDWLLINMAAIEIDHNPFYYSVADCSNAVSVNIRGYQCKNAQIYMQQEDEVSGNSGWHLSVDSNYSGCGCTAINTGSVLDEFDFGIYSPRYLNKNFSCSKNSSSTTNWWLGVKISEFTPIVSNNPTVIPSDGPTINIMTTNVDVESTVLNTGRSGGNNNATNMNSSSSSTSESYDGDSGGNNDDGKIDELTEEIMLWIILSSVVLLVLVLIIAFICTIRYFNKKHEKLDRLLDYSDNNNSDNNNNYNINGNDNYYDMDNINEREEKEIEMTDVTGNINNNYKNTDNINTGDNYKPPSRVVTSSLVKDKNNHEGSDDDDDMYECAEEGQAPGAFNMVTGIDDIGYTPSSSTVSGATAKAFANDNDDNNDNNDNDDNDENASIVSNANTNGNINAAVIENINNANNSGKDIYDKGAANLAADDIVMHDIVEDIKTAQTT